MNPLQNSFGIKSESGAGTIVNVSVIIVNYNSSSFIQDCFQSLLKNIDKNDEIIVVDNNSTDDSVEIIKKYKNIKLIQLKKNLGYGAGCNTGAKNAKGNFLFFMNPDVQLLNPINRIKKLYSENPDYSVIVPAVLISNKIYSSIWRLPTVLREFFGDLNLIKRKYYPINKTYKQTTIEINKNQFASGAALFIKKDIFNKIGGFDKNFFMYFEDTDLFARIHALHDRSFLSSNVKITHLVGESSTGLGAKKTIYHYSSKFYYFKKHYPNMFFNIHRTLTIIALILKIIIFSILYEFSKNKSQKIKTYFSCIKIYLNW